MKKNKIISSLLALSLLASSMISNTFTVPVYAAEETKDNGMKIDKKAEVNPDGSYKITLEAYATGKTITNVVNTDVPTDIVLVLDQSGSMADYMNTYDFRRYTEKNNEEYFKLRHNGSANPNLYYKLGEKGYATVSVIASGPSQSNSYKECPESWTNSTNKSNDYNNYWMNSNNLYVKENGSYQKVILKREEKELIVSYYKYTYIFPDGTEVVSYGNKGTPEFNGKGPLYVLQNTGTGTTKYTYSYTDKENIKHIIGESEGAATKPTNIELYERLTKTMSRLVALKEAVKTFEEAVAQKAKGSDGQLGTSDDVDHRIAVVGFASKSDYGNNTELLSINGGNSGQVGVKYNDIEATHLKAVLQSMKTTDGQTMVNKAINALAAQGATEANLGMDMAQRILEANPVPKDKKRNRVVIFFTDGQPTTSDGFKITVANAAIEKAGLIKNAGASVYAVGIFEGADATSLGDKNGDIVQKSNWFMQSVSSNNGKLHNPSYYLSAADAGTLNSIFEQIAANIEQNESATTLNADAVIKDIIAPSFTLPEGTTTDEISLKTYTYGEGGSWTENANSMGAKATIEGATVSVTGFDFAKNWCGTEKSTDGKETYRGNKLVISFDVVPKTGFLGGNKVPTNDHADVYENEDAETPIDTFPVPTVDVPIENITVSAPDKNVYLLQNVPASELKQGTVKVGDVTLDLSKADQNYALDSWQNHYVDINVEVKDANGNAVSSDGLQNLTDDTKYTVSVTVSPKYEGTAKKESGNGSGHINVFKPELTFKDGEAYYGEDATKTDFTANKVGEDVWKHGDTLSTTGGVTMIGNKPELTMKYTPDATKLADDKYTKQDLPVKATVKIGETDVTDKTTFVHQACSPECGWTAPNSAKPGDPAFLMHIKTCQLTINKTGGAAGEPYVFTVKKDGTKYSEVTIVGNDSVTISELPVGTYTIEEDTGWSWRYKSTINNPAILSSESQSGNLTCNNEKNKHYWLNGFSSVVHNIYNRANN